MSQKQMIISDKGLALIEHCMRGGTYGYYWNKQRKETFWWKVTDGPPAVPEHWLGEDIYFGVNPVAEIPKRRTRQGIYDPTKIRAENDEIQCVNAIFSDLDVGKEGFRTKPELGRHVAGLNPQPSVVVDSGGGYHPYWLLDKAYTAKEAEMIQRGWPGIVGGDPATKDLARVLRIPGLCNYKLKGEPRLVRVVGTSSRRYSLGDLRDALELKLNVQASEDSTTRSDPTYYYDGSRNFDLLRMAGDLARRGATEEVMYAALKARSEGQHKPPLEDKRIRQIAGSARWPAVPEMLSASANDEGNAQCFVRLFGKQFIHTTQAGWMFYNGKCWERNEHLARYSMVMTLAARRLAVKKSDDFDKYKSIHSAANETWTHVRNALTHAETYTMGSYEDFDKEPDSLNCHNGVLDLRTGELMPHAADQRFTYYLEAEYNPDATCPLWMEFLNEVVGGEADRPEVIGYLQEAVGYTFTGRTNEECLFYLQGPTRGGKGTFTETLRALLGRRLSWSVSFNTFSGTRRAGDQNFDLAPMRNCRFVAAGEGARTAVLNADFIKRISGGDELQASFKHQEPFNYRPKYKIWLSSNFEPNTDPSDTAVWGRLRVIRFPHSWLGKEDKRLKERLQDARELEGILVWVVEGAKRWYATGGKGLATPPFVQRAGEQARATVDYVKRWADDELEHTGDPGDVILARDYYSAYLEWYTREGFGHPRHARRQNAVTKDLKRLGYTLSGNVDKVKCPRSGRWGRGLVGYKLCCGASADTNLWNIGDKLAMDLE